MKKKIIAIFISLIALPALGEEKLKPIAEFNPVDSAIFCQVDISPLEIKSIGDYDVVTSSDCYQSTEVGQAGLPVRSFFVLLPAEAEVKDVTITSIEQIKLAGEYNLKPVSPPIPISKGFTTPQTPIPQGEDFYPENILKLNSIQKLRGYSLACISVFAASYNPKIKQLTWNKQVNFKLNLTSSKTKTLGTTFRGLEEDVDLVKGLVVNPELTASYDLRIKPLQPVGSYTYIIITDAGLVAAFQSLLDFKKGKGLTGTIATTQWIENNYNGTDTQERIKAFITDYYKTYCTQYVLLGGDVDIIPYRKVYAKVTDGALQPIVYEDWQIPCDLYYACLGDDWDTDKNGIYGELGTDTTDLMPEVYIGRAPVSNTSEVDNFVDKVITYENSPDNYLYNELLIAYKLDQVNDGKEIMKDIDDYTPANYTIHQEYESEGRGVKGDVISWLNFGIGLVAHAGHGNYNILQAGPSSSYIYIGINDVKSLSNGSKTFIFNTIACIAGDFSQTDCIGEEMILNSHGGAVAFIGNSRYGWYDEDSAKLYSGEYQIEFFNQLFNEGYENIGKTFAMDKITFIPRCGTQTPYTPYRWIMFCLNLLGDPEMFIHFPRGIRHIDYYFPVIEDVKNPVDLTVTIKNFTLEEVKDVRGTISTNDPYITTIIKDNAFFGDIPPQGTSTGTYTIQVNSDCPSIHQAYFQLEIGGDGGYHNTDTFTLEINLKVDNLSQVFPYPNPCYPGKGQIVTLANIPLNSHAEVSIYNLAGELVRLLNEEGSEIKKFPGSEQAVWNAKNDKGKNVASGIYIYLLKSDAGIKKGKIAIIR